VAPVQPPHHEVVVVVGKVEVVVAIEVPEKVQLHLKFAEIIHVAVVAVVRLVVFNMMAMIAIEIEIIVVIEIENEIDHHKILNYSSLMFMITV